VRVLASCDSSYFKEHAKAFAISAKLAGYDPIIVLVNPDESCEELIKELNFCTISKKYSNKTSPTFYACSRFLYAPDWISPDGILITDIDCYFNNLLPTPEEDIGLFFRDDPRLHAKLAVGIVWYNNNERAKKFADIARSCIEQEPEKWFADQIGMYKAYDIMKDNISVFKFTLDHMDWTFRPQSYMWTGKGPRKYKDPNYLTKKEWYENSSI
jgi:hypothetical protein